LSATLIAIVGFVYAYIAIEQLFKGNSSMAVVYGGYAIGNVGLYLLAK
jgi:hypothetical protein